MHGLSRLSMKSRRRVNGADAIPPAHLLGDDRVIDNPLGFV
jgi:hypothetical protein